MNEFILKARAMLLAIQSKDMHMVLSFEEQQGKKLPWMKGNPWLIAFIKYHEDQYRDYPNENLELCGYSFLLAT